MGTCGDTELKLSDRITVTSLAALLAWTVRAAIETSARQIVISLRVRVLATVITLPQVMCVFLMKRPLPIGWNRRPMLHVL
jgi:hypothetical protein